LNKLEFMKILLLILISISLFITGCSSKENSTKKQVQTEPKQQDIIKKEKDKKESLNYNLVKKLIQKYPSALVTDSIEDSYTYFLQQQLSKCSYLLLFSEADIKDFKGTNKGYSIITLSSCLPQIIGHFKVKDELVTRLIKELKPDDTYVSGCFVVSVNKIIPVKTELILDIEEFDKTIESSESDIVTVTKKDISDNVQIGLGSVNLPFYFLNGELIDFYIIK
jgi:hypothetical protein